MVRTGEIRLRGRRRNSARAAISRRESLLLGWWCPRRSGVARRPSTFAGCSGSRSALQRASEVNMVLFGARVDLNHASIEGPGVRLSGLA